MPGWENSNRRDRLPADWPKIRKRILKRDNYECQTLMEDGQRCRDLANEVDHKRAGDDHRDSNLEAICEWHHRKKSSSEGAVALAIKRKKIRNSFRRTEAHPGLL